MPTATLPRARERVYRAYGAAAELMFDRRDPEIVLSGPAGTGKSRACLEYVHRRLLEHPGARVLIVRKTLTSLVGTGVVTYREKVLDPRDGVQFFGGSKQEPAAFKYPNASKLVVGGLDKASKIMSSEYDMAYVQEATEIGEGDWEALSTRLRWGVMPEQQLLADCNPDRPSHWLKQRANRGQVRMLESRHEDNPSVTQAYLDRLRALTGVRYKRLYLGLWAAAEGMIYDGWDPAVHRVDPFPIPAGWPRFWAIDFGYTNPFVWQAWAQDPDGRLYLYREMYRTQRTVEEHAAHILRVTNGEPRPRAVICDHDAEGRATFERHAKLSTVAARKAVSTGIQAVMTRLKPAGDGRPRLLLMRDALVERDMVREEAKRPCATEEEIESYVWDTSSGRKKGEEPVKDDDHGMDAMRYLVMHIDSPGRRLVTW